MSQGIYITSAEPRSGKSVVVLGIMEMLAGQDGQGQGSSALLFRTKRSRTISQTSLSGAMA